MSADNAFPAERSPDGVRADEETLGWELQAVCDRHNNDMSHAEIVKCLLGMIDSYAHAKRVSYHFGTERAPADAPVDRDEVPVVHVPGTDSDKIVPLFALKPEECEHR
jgi:hypothetical protein